MPSKFIVEHHQWIVSPVTVCVCVLHFSLRKGIGKRREEGRKRAADAQEQVVALGFKQRCGRCLGSSPVLGTFLCERTASSSGYVNSLHRTSTVFSFFLSPYCLLLSLLFVFVRRGASCCLIPCHRGVCHPLSREHDHRTCQYQSAFPRLPVNKMWREATAPTWRDYCALVRPFAASGEPT